MKYNLEELHWQEFEFLAFKIVQILISSDVQFIEGGSDKGRDFVHTGKSQEYKNQWSGKWIFQAKHKTKDTKTLNSDLKTELEKVFIKNNLDYDNYVLITNKTIDGTLFDKLNDTFKNFTEEHKLNCKNFSVLGYRNIETCIDNSESLKWSFPNIISHPNFKILLRDTVNHNLNIRKKGWLRSIEKQREKFVFTEFFNKANEKLKKYPIIILSGPPKSGKTFNAEILALNFYVFKKFEPILIDNAEEIEKFFETERKQIFICDDAFGKHSLSYKVEDWFQKIDRIFNLADDSHLFIFTSREYIFREFMNSGNKDAELFIKKIIVESHNYSHQEKISILNRYTKLSEISEYDKSSINLSEKEIINHKNFSPETIRAFFANISIDNNHEQLKELNEHLEKPDAYLSLVFSKLNNVKQAALLSVLCSLKNSENSIYRTFETICNDMNINMIVDSKLQFDELDDSILRILKSNKIEEINFYHPSMQDFLIRQFVQSETGKLREIVLKNLNIDLLDISLIKSSKKSLFATAKGKVIKFNNNDISKLEIGLNRLISNSDLSTFHIAYLLKWFKSESHSLDLKLNDIPLYNSAKSILKELLNNICNIEFYYYHKDESCENWSNLLSSINTISILYSINLDNYDFNYLIKLIDDKKDNETSWMLIFRAVSLLNEEMLLENVGKNRLNDFYTKLRKDIYELGHELFGSDYPEFKVYNQERLEKKFPQKRKHKPNKSWYPRFLKVKERIDILKEIKGTKIGKNILERLTTPYEEINQVTDYAKNRYGFNTKKGWWKK